MIVIINKLKRLSYGSAYINMVYLRILLLYNVKKKIP